MTTDPRPMTADPHSEPGPAIRRNRVLAVLALVALLLLPLTAMTRQTGTMTYYLGQDYPPGQSAYIMMRVAGHLAYTLVFLQIVLGLLHRPLQRALGLGPLLSVHRSVGLAAFLLALSHPILFEWARQLRTGQSTITATFWPPIDHGFYELHQYFGAMGLYLLLIGVLAGVYGPRLAPKAWRAVHAVNYMVFFLVWYHSLRIGTSTRIGMLPVLYTVLAAVVVGLTLQRLRRRTGSRFPEGLTSRDARR